MWATVDERLALLELLTRGTLRSRRSQEHVHRWLAELPWTRATGRRDEVGVVAERRTELVDLLDRVWPTWRDDHLALLELGLPPTPDGWRRLQDHRRTRALPALPSHVNRRTAAALTGPHAKAGLTASRRAGLDRSVIVDDGLVRLRPPPGLTVRRGSRVLALDDVVAVLGEVGIGDRALRDGLVLEGGVDALLLVENLGAFWDMPRPDRWLLAYVPGWDTATVRQLARGLDAPVVHFGDLDPNGVRIHRHLRDALPGLRWLVPSFWREYVDDHGQLGAWPDGLDLSDAPALVQELAAAGRWLEQEVIVLDGRLSGEMRAVL